MKIVIIYKGQHLKGMCRCLWLDKAGVQYRDFLLASLIPLSGRISGSLLVFKEIDYRHQQHKGIIVLIVIAEMASALHLQNIVNGLNICKVIENKGYVTVNGNFDVAMSSLFMVTTLGRQKPSRQLLSMELDKKARKLIYIKRENKEKFKFK